MQAQLKVGAKKKLPSDSKRYLFKSASQKTKSGLVEEFEVALAKIPGVSQAEAFNIRRTSRD